MGAAGELSLTERTQFDEFWRFTLTWPNAKAQLYQFVEAIETPHRSPSVLVAAVCLPPDQLIARLEGWADPERAVFIALSSGHNLSECILRIKYDDPSYFNFHEAKPDISLPLRRAEKAFLDGTLVNQWRTFADLNGKDQLVYDTPNPTMHKQAALANGFKPEVTDNGRTYWRRDL